MSAVIEFPAWKPYRPSNGTEGSLFERDWCERCQHDAKYRITNDGSDGCQILAKMMFLGVDEPGYPPEIQARWRDGYEARCTAFEPTRSTA